MAQCSASISVVITTEIRSANSGKSSLKSEWIRFFFTKYSLNKRKNFYPKKILRYFYRNINRDLALRSNTIGSAFSYFAKF